MYWSRVNVVYACVLYVMTPIRILSVATSNWRAMLEKKAFKKTYFSCWDVSDRSMINTMSNWQPEIIMKIVMNICLRTKRIRGKNSFSYDEIW